VDEAPARRGVLVGNLLHLGRDALRDPDVEVLGVRRTDEVVRSPLLLLLEIVTLLEEAENRFVADLLQILSLLYRPLLELGDDLVGRADLLSHSLRHIVFLQCPTGAQYARIKMPGGCPADSVPGPDDAGCSVRVRTTTFRSVMS